MHMDECLMTASARPFADLRHRLSGPLSAAFLGAVIVAGSVASVGLASQPAAAQQVMRIAAVVNDDIVTALDVQSRMAMVIGTSGLPNTPETRQKLLPRVIQQLIDERLKLQESKRLGIEVAQPEIDQAKRQIERNNNLPAGMIDQMMSQSGVDPTTLESQIRADVAWIKMARTTLQRQITIEPEEVDAVLDQLRRDLGKPENLLAEIVLPVNSPDQEDSVIQLAQRMVQEIRGGANFAALARQFSASPTAAVGGDLGWLPRGRLEPDVERHLSNLQPGQVTEPFRTSGGWTIMALRDRRQTAAPTVDETPIDIAQLVIPVGGAAALPDDRLQEVRARAAAITTCDQMDTVSVEFNLPSSGRLGAVVPAKMPPAIRSVAISLPEKTLSPAISYDNTEIRLMVCERKAADGLPSRRDIEDKLLNEKLQRSADRALRDLRRRAMIDIRR